jgi:spore germination cell wall hydrolase CwlJ-like protein
MALTDYSIDTSGTPQEMQRRQALAEVLMQKGMDTSPAAGGKNGAWLTALNRGLAGALGGYQSGQAREEDRAGRASVNYSGYAGGTPLGNALSPQAPPSGPAAASSIAPDTAGKIYSNDEPSPLDPPSGDDRKNLQMAVIGEAGNEPQLGKTGVASVVRTRAVDGGYGGNTPTGVVTAPNQFEPFNTPEGRARMARGLMEPKQLASADDAIDQAYGTGKYVSAGPNDPTEGMTHFYSPKGQAALGRPAPAWAGGDSVTIGGHVFNSPDDKIPANAAVAQGQLPTQVAGTVTPDSKPERFGPEWAAEVINNRFAPPALKQVAASVLSNQTKKESYIQETDPKTGDVYNVNRLTGQKTMLKAAEKDPASRQEYDAYASDEKAAGRQPVSYGQFLNKPGIGAAAGSPDNSTLVGDEFLKTLPRGEADIVKKIAEYDIDPKSLSTKGGHREDLLKKVSQYDADYSEPLYSSRKAAIKEFGAGGPSSPAGQITAGNTAILHAGEMSDALEKLKKDNSGVLGTVGQAGIPFVSYYSQALHNRGIKGTGTEESRALSEFQTAKNHFSEEVTKFYAGSGGSEAERERALANIDEAKSLPELQSAIQQEARLMGGKINTLQDRIKTAMGPSAWKRAMKEAGGQFPIVQQQSADQLAKIEKRASGEKTSEGSIPKLEVGQSHKDGDVTITKISH